MTNRLRHSQMNQLENILLMIISGENIYMMVWFIEPLHP